MLLIAQGPNPTDTWRKPLPALGTVVLGRDPGLWNAPWEPFLARRHVELSLKIDRLKVRRLGAAANPALPRRQAVRLVRDSPWRVVRHRPHGLYTGRSIGPATAFALR